MNRRRDLPSFVYRPASSDTCYQYDALTGSNLAIDPSARQKCERPVKDNSCCSPPTIIDVARLAGVSRATAARVLGNYGSAGPDARKLVLDAAEQLAYRPNQLARSIATGRSKAIGLVIPDTESFHFARAIRAVTDIATENGFVVFLATTDEDIKLERDAVRALLAKRVDGMIVSPASSIDVEHLAGARDMDCPIVLLDRRVPLLSADTFAVDNFRAANQAVKSLIERGHRQVALVSNAPSDPQQKDLISSVSERIDGYRATLHDAGNQIAGNRIIRGGRGTNNLARLVRALCDSPDRPTAFLATDSSVALVLIRALRELNLTIPEDVSLVCFDDADWTAAIAPPLSVISLPIRELASAATANLIARIKGDSTGPAKETLLPASLIDRGSVRSV
ncbi:putative LacI family transcriptional regulator [Rhizobium rhizogenes NBRC 13257]|uniref:LacI family transcriptional regulator n=1 Tax=Rhizobium rhizogenes NBRC 13257 TaxID=1220581 RepID=A0AA87Q7E3_RHIRH|nr:putative LacI family transcriptional regulator [Rhizobium rhizogenes NBRC 13257]